MMHFWAPLCKQVPATFDHQTQSSDKMHKDHHQKHSFEKKWSRSTIKYATCPTPREKRDITRRILELAEAKSCRSGGKQWRRRVTLLNLLQPSYRVVKIIRIQKIVQVVQTIGDHGKLRTALETILQDSKGPQWIHGIGSFNLLSLGKVNTRSNPLPIRPYTQTRSLTIKSKPQTTTRRAR